MSETLNVLAAIAVIVAFVVLLNARQVTTIYPPNVGLFYRNGKFVRELGPGRHSSFDPLGRTRIVKVSKARQPTQLGEITVLSRDQFSFRLGLAPILEVVDARAFVESQGIVEGSSQRAFMPQVIAHSALHPLAASAAMEAVAARTLREIVTEPKQVTDAIRGALEEAIPGAKVEKVLATSINLPPETRKMFTEGERARMEGEAALERARSEQASLRALSNAARLIKDNPALANLRFLQTVEQSPGPKTIVVGSAHSPTVLPGA